jgi:hypothetical protein
MLPRAFTHRRVFVGVLALPPDEIMPVAAKNEWCTFHAGDGNTIVNNGTALMANAAVSLFRRNGAVPGNALVSVFIEA